MLLCFNPTKIALVMRGTLDDSHRTGTTEIVQQLKVVPHHSKAYVLTIFFRKYIVWSHISIYLLSSMFSSTLLIARTISVFPVRWLSSTVPQIYTSSHLAAEISVQ